MTIHKTRVHELEVKLEKVKCEMELAINILKFHNVISQREVQLLKENVESLNLIVHEIESNIQQLSEQNTKLQEEVKNYKELASPDSDDDDLFFIDNVELDRQLQEQKKHHLQIINSLKKDNHILSVEITKLKDKLSTYSSKEQVYNDVHSINNSYAFKSVDDLIQRQNLKHSIGKHNSLKNSNNAKEFKRGKKK